MACRTCRNTPCFSYGELSTNIQKEDKMQEIVKAEKGNVGGAFSNGRPKGAKNKAYPAREKVVAWRKNHPGGTMRQCAANLGISTKTVCKYWHETEIKFKSMWDFYAEGAGNMRLRVECDSDGQNLLDPFFAKHRAGGSNEYALGKYDYDYLLALLHLPCAECLSVCRSGRTPKQRCRQKRTRHDWTVGAGTMRNARAHLL